MRASRSNCSTFAGPGCVANASRTFSRSGRREAITRLRDEQRQVIILRFIEDLDYREVAAIVGKSVAAVRVIQHRALNALRKQMKLLDPVT